MPEVDTSSVAADRPRLRPGFGATELRAMIGRIGFSQGDAARELEVDERTIRSWASGEQRIPRMAELALNHLLHSKNSSAQPPRTVLVRDSETGEMVKPRRLVRDGLERT